MVAMLGGVKDDRMGYLEPADVTDADFAQAITDQLKWLHSLDEVPSEERGLGPPK
jgi:hypothetical protein